MIVEWILLAVFIISAGVTAFVLARKIPVLNNLPQHGSIGIKKHHYIRETERKIKEILISIEKQIYLHKLLSWIKILTLRVETIIDKYLHRIRKKAQEVEKKQKIK